jgi:hypothetical protein
MEAMAVSRMDMDLPALAPAATAVDAADAALAPRSSSIFASLRFSLALLAFAAYPPSRKASNRAWRPITQGLTAALLKAHVNIAGTAISDFFYSFHFEKYKSFQNLAKLTYHHRGPRRLHLLQCQTAVAVRVSLFVKNRNFF